eukprot:2259435-Pyramimonas_sp.AAC.1
MSKVVLSELSRKILVFDRVTTARVYVTAAAKRVVVVKEDDFFAKAGARANPVKSSKALYIEFKTWSDNEC